MVERFELNKLYVNSYSRQKIVKCEFITSSGAAVLTFVCRHPDQPSESFNTNLHNDLLSSSPENWDEFTLPEAPGLTKWAVSYLSAPERPRVMCSTIFETEETAIAYTQRTSLSEAKREILSYLVHPVLIPQRQTLEQFVRSMEEQEEFV